MVLKYEFSYKKNQLRNFSSLVVKCVVPFAMSFLRFFIAIWLVASVARALQDQVINDQDSNSGVFGEFDPTAIDLADVPVHGYNSFTRSSSVTLDKVFQLQSQDWQIAEPYICDDILVIQQEATYLHNLVTLLPYRSFIVIDCRNSYLDSSIVINVPNIKTFDRDIIRGTLQATYHVDAFQLYPGRTLSIGGRSISVISEEVTQQYIISVNGWLNIENKNRFHEESGIFSMYSPKYKEHFIAYANQLPFSQSTLLQLVFLGSVPVNSSINDERRLSSNFLDVDFCTQKVRCDGGSFSPDETTWELAQAYLLYDYLNKKFVNYKQPNQQSVRSRFLVSEFVQYPTNIKEIGYFAFVYAAFVAAKPSKIDGAVDNELPHELGHTYKLPDLAGYDNFMYKHKSYRYDRDLSIDYPFDEFFVTRRGSMNGGFSNSGYFTSFNVYSNYFADNQLKSAAPLDPLIDINGGTSICVVFIFGNIFPFQINVKLPSEYQPSNDPNAITVSLMGKTYTLQDKDIQMLVIDPEHASKLMNGGSGLVFWPRYLVSRKIFVRDDALVLDPPLKGNAPEYYDLMPSSIYVNSFGWDDCDYTYTVLKEYAGRKQIIHVFAQNENTICIPLLDFMIPTIAFHNRQRHIVTIKSTTLPDFEVPPSDIATLVYYNGWTLMDDTNTILPNTFKVNFQNAGLYVENTEHFENYLSISDNLEFVVYNGYWKKYFGLPLLRDQYLNSTVTYRSTATFTTIIMKQAGGVLQLFTNDDYRFIYKNGWSFTLLDSSTAFDLYSIMASEQVSNLDQPTFIKQLFNVGSSHYAKITDNNIQHMTQIQLPSLGFDKLGVALTIDMSGVTSKFLTVDGGHFSVRLHPYSMSNVSFAFTDPWTIREKDIHRRVPTHIDEKNFNVTFQTCVSKTTTTDIYTYTLEDLQRHRANSDYLYDVLQQYNTININLQRNVWIESLELHPPKNNINYFNLLGSKITITSSTPTPTVLNLGTRRVTINNGDQYELELLSGWIFT